MKTVLNSIERSTLEDFADKNDLEMIVSERGKDRGVLERYHAAFYGCEWANGGFLVGVYGNGNTPEEAISDYTRQLSGKHLCISPRKGKELRITAPIFVDASGKEF